MSAITAVVEYRAMKEYRCLWCGERIEIGEFYSRYRVFMDGEASTVRMHPECYGAMQNAAKAEGGWIEWTPGDGERPA